MPPHVCDPGCPAMHQVRPGLFVGSALAGEDADALRAAGVERVLAVGPPPAHPDAFESMHVDILDLPEALLLRHLPAAVAFARGGSVLVHCAYGQSRSVTVAAALLALDEGLDAAAAVEAVEAARPCARGGMNPGFRRQLELFVRRGGRLGGGEYNAWALCEERGLGVPSWGDVPDGVGAGAGSCSDVGAGAPLRCGSCGREVAAAEDVLPHAGRCASVFLGPVEGLGARHGSGKLGCPGCGAKLGSYSVEGGVECGCGERFRPAYNVGRKRLR